MPQSKEREVLIVNLVLIILSVGSVAVAIWTVAANWFRGGTDDLFLILVALMLALLFAINPAIWAYEQGWLRNPLKGRKAARGVAGEKEDKVAAG